MKIIKLNILASDIIETNYHRDSDCAITRALKRAGEEITDLDLSSMVGGSLGNKTYGSLLHKVMGMYGTKDNLEYFNNRGIVPFLKIQDFEHELIIEE